MSLISSRSRVRVPPPPPLRRSSASRAPPSYSGGRGCKPRRRDHGQLEQSGVLASLSRRRSPVQIRYGPHMRCWSCGVLATLSRWRPRVQIPHSAPDAIVAERLQAPAFQAGDEGSSPSGGSRIVPCLPFPEVVRLAEDTVSKTARGRKAPRGFESLRLRRMTLGVIGSPPGFGPGRPGSSPGASARSRLG